MLTQQAVFLVNYSFISDGAISFRSTKPPVFSLNGSGCGGEYIGELTSVSKVEDNI